MKRKKARAQALCRELLFARGRREPPPDAILARRKLGKKLKLSCARGRGR